MTASFLLLLSLHETAVGVEKTNSEQKDFFIYRREFTGFLVLKLWFVVS